MSRQASEKQYKGTKNDRPNHAAAKKATFVVFRPGKEEREEIRSDDAPLIQRWAELVSYVLSGHKVSVGYRPENDSIYIHLRDGETDWDKAVTLSVFHNDPAVALRTICYGLRGRYSEFPDIQLSLFDDDVNW